MRLSVAFGFLLTSVFVSASPVFPRIPDTLPEGTSRVAFDEDAGLLIAFDNDGNELGSVQPSVENVKRDEVVGACSALSADDAQKCTCCLSPIFLRREGLSCLLSLPVPGWSKLEAEAEKTWGDGGRNIVTNPDEVSSDHAPVALI